MRRKKLDLNDIQSAVVAGLPERARWTIRGVSLTFDFSSARRGLRPITSRGFGGAVPIEWLDLLVFGEYDYAEGGGACPFIAVRQRDGAVCGLDVELEDEKALFLFNSSVGRFIESFVALEQHLSGGRSVLTDIEQRVRKIDPKAYPVSEWRSLIEHLAAA